MQSWVAADPDHPTFMALLSHRAIPTPPDRAISTETDELDPIDVASTGSGFRALRRLHFDNMKISDTETLTWAADLLSRYSPLLGKDDSFIWTPPISILPDSILSEQDTAMYGKYAFLQPALTAAIFLHANHYRLSPTEAGRHPFGNWAVQDRSIVGSGRQKDLVIARRHVAGKMTMDPIAVACQAVTSFMCCSKGTNTDGVYSHDIPVMHELQRWLEHHETIPMVPPEESQAVWSPSRLAYYPEAWQRRIQNFMFQVCTQLVRMFPVYSRLRSVVLAPDNN